MIATLVCHGSKSVRVNMVAPQSSAHGFQITCNELWDSCLTPLAAERHNQHIVFCKNTGEDFDIGLSLQSNFCSSFLLSVSQTAVGISNPCFLFVFCYSRCAFKVSLVSAICHALQIFSAIGFGSVVNGSCLYCIVYLTDFRDKCDFERTGTSYPVVALNSLVRGFVVVVAAVALFWKTSLEFLDV